MSSPPTSFALLNAPTGIELILVALPPILLTLSLRTFTRFGPPKVASTPRSLAEKETARSSSYVALNAALTAFLASGPTARMMVLVVWRFWPIFPQPLFGHSGEVIHVGAHPSALAFFLNPDAAGQGAQ
eukprot:16452377-Heterocapsa_arctica.AAC.2